MVKIKSHSDDIRATVVSVIHDSCGVLVLPPINKAGVTLTGHWKGKIRNQGLSYFKGIQEFIKDRGLKGAICRIFTEL